MDSMPPQTPVPGNEDPAGLGGQPAGQYTPPAETPQPYTPGSVQAPYQPPSQGGQYQQAAPPPGTMAPPPYGQQYGPGMPPPPPRKGFPWLAVCGITCGVLLLVLIGVGTCTYKFMKPFVQMGAQVATLTTEIQKADPAMIRREAVPVSAEELAQNPSLYSGKWIAVEGTVLSGGSQNPMAQQSFSNQQTTNYMLGTSVMVMDVNNGPQIAQAGESMRAYGKFYAWDITEMSKIPFVGKTIEEAIKKDPELSKMKSFIMFITKDIEKASGTFPGAPKQEPAADAAASGDIASGDSGWAK
jgi:hypothetical protein